MNGYAWLCSKKALFIKQMVGHRLASFYFGVSVSNRVFCDLRCHDFSFQLGLFHHWVCGIGFHLIKALLLRAVNVLKILTQSLSDSVSRCLQQCSNTAHVLNLSSAGVFIEEVLNKWRWDYEKLEHKITLSSIQWSVTCSLSRTRNLFNHVCFPEITNIHIWFLLKHRLFPSERTRLELLC